MPRLGDGAPSMVNIEKYTSAKTTAGISYF